MQDVSLLILWSCAVVPPSQAPCEAIRPLGMRTHKATECDTIGRNMSWSTLYSEWSPLRFGTLRSGRVVAQSEVSLWWRRLPNLWQHTRFWHKREKSKVFKAILWLRLKGFPQGSEQVGFQSCRLALIHDLFDAAFDCNVWTRLLSECTEALQIRVVSLINKRTTQTARTSQIDSMA